MVNVLHVPHALFGLFSLWLCISHSCFFRPTSNGSVWNLRAKEVINKKIWKKQIWLILVSEILILIYVALKLFTRLHEVNKKIRFLEKWLQRIAVTFRYNIWGGYRNYSNISRWNFQASRGFEEIGSGSRRWNTRSYKMGRYDRYTWSCYIAPYKWPKKHTQMLNRHGLFTYIWLIW